MKRLTGLFGALILGFSLTTTALTPRDTNALGGLLFGLPLGIDLDEGHIVNKVYVQVSKGWLNSDNFTLGINIFGMNGGYHHHGSQDVQLSASEILGMEKATALVAIDWTEDSIPTHSPETYTVCVQIITNDSPIGGAMCDSFGEY